MKTFTDITGIILVGGKSRRMGRDKAFLEVGDRPLVAPVIELFRENFSRVVLVGDRPGRFSGFGLPVVPDTYPGSSLGGLHAGLAHARTNHIFVASCDMPFPCQPLLRYLCSLRAGSDVVVPKGAGGYEPLFAVYSRNCLGPMERHLESGRLNIRSIYPHVRVRDVGSAELERLDPAGTCFVNVNTPEDLANLGSAAGEEQRLTCGM